MILINILSPIITSIITFFCLSFLKDFLKRIQKKKEFEDYLNEYLKKAKIENDLSTKIPNKNLYLAYFDANFDKKNNSKVQICGIDFNNFLISETDDYDLCPYLKKDKFKKYISNNNFDEHNYTENITHFKKVLKKLKINYSDHRSSYDCFFHKEDLKHEIVTFLINNDNSQLLTKKNSKILRQFFQKK